MSDEINTSELNERTSLVMNIAFVLLMVCSPLYYASIGSYNVYQILSIILVCGIALTWIRIHPIIISLDKFTLYYFLNIVQVIISNILQGDNWLQASKTLLIAFVIMILPVKEKTARIVIPAMALSGAITGFVMIGQGTYYAGFRMTLTVGGVQQDPNWIPLLFVITFAYGLFQIRNRRIPFIIRLLLFAFSLLAVYETILTGSRGALIGLIVLFVIWLINEMGVSVIKGALILAGLIILYYFYVNYVKVSLSTMLTARLTSVGEDSRLTIWSNLISSYVRGNPFQLIFGRGDRSCVRNLGMGAHNDFLEALYEFGILGLTFKLLYWYYLLKTMRQKCNILCYSILLCLMTESLFSPIQSIIYFVMPLACAICSSKYGEPSKNKYIRIKL